MAATPCPGAPFRSPLALAFVDLFASLFAVDRPALFPINGVESKDLLFLNRLTSPEGPRSEASR